MSETESSTVACPACRRRFVWKPQLSGKAVKCTCGKAFVIPPAPDALPSRESLAAAASTVSLGAGDFESPEPEAPPAPLNCPSCNLPMRPRATLCLNCGYDVREGGRLRTQVIDDADPAAGSPSMAAAGAPDAPDPDQPFTPMNPGTRSRSRVAEALVSREDDQAESRFLDLYLPIIFIVAGIGLTVLHAVQQDETVTRGFIEAAMHLLLKVPLMLAALTLTAKLIGISYGPLSIGLLKLAGLAMGPMALADLLLGVILRETMGFGIWLGAFFYIIITGVPLSFMFDLEMNETVITLVVVVVLQVFFSVFILALLLGMLV